MALQHIRFDIDGDVQYARAFELLERESRDMTDPLERIGHSVVDAVGRQFQTEGAFGLGRRWPSLSKAYAAWKAEHFPARPLLVASGDMRAAALDEDLAVRVTPQRMTYTVHDEKATWHQRGEGNNPARKIVALPSITRRQWDRHLAEWVNDIRRGPIGR